MTGLVPPRALQLICAAQQDLYSAPLTRLIAADGKKKIKAGAPVGSALLDEILRRAVGKIVAREAIDLLTKPIHRLRITATQKARQLWQNVKSISATR